MRGIRTILLALTAILAVGVLAGQSIAGLGDYHYIKLNGVSTCTNVSFPQTNWFNSQHGMLNAVDATYGRFLLNAGGTFYVGYASNGQVDVVVKGNSQAANMHMGGPSLNTWTGSTMDGNKTPYYMVDSYVLYEGECPGTRPIPQPQNCPEFLVISSRGSGVGPEDQGWGGGFGLPGQSFANDFKRLVGTERVKTQYNNYEAVGILPTLDEIIGALRISPAGVAGYIKAIRQALNGLGALVRQNEIGAYHASVVNGETILKRMINQVIATCESATKLLLTGYSQGAQVTSDVYQTLNADRRQYIWGVVLFSDPKYNHLSFADTAKRDNNGILPVRGEFPADSHDKVRSYCHARDPVCQGLGQFLLHGKEAHNGYQWTDAQAAAKYFAGLAVTSDSPKQPPTVPDK